MTAIASTLGVARSNLIERQARTSKSRGRYHKTEDSQLLPLIRLQGGQDLPKVNTKRVLRILHKARLGLAASHRPSSWPDP